MFVTENRLEFHSRARPTLWQLVGSSCEKSQDSSQESHSKFFTQIEACLNSRPLPSDDDCIEALTQGHFLIGRSLEALPDSSSSYPFSVDGIWSKQCLDTFGSDGLVNMLLV